MIDTTTTFLHSKCREYEDCAKFKSFVQIFKRTFEFFSKPLMSYCVPGSLAIFIDRGNAVIKFLNSFDIFTKMTSDIARAWREILQLCVIALGIPPF